MSNRPRNESELGILYGFALAVSEDGIRIAMAGGVDGQEVFASDPIVDLAPETIVAAIEQAIEREKHGYEEEAAE